MGTDCGDAAEDFAARAAPMLASNRKGEPGTVLIGCDGSELVKARMRGMVWCVVCGRCRLNKVVRCGGSGGVAGVRWDPKSGSGKCEGMVGGA